jgi:hypothetical protein
MERKREKVKDELVVEDTSGNRRHANSDTVRLMCPVSRRSAENMDALSLQETCQEDRARPKRKEETMGSFPQIRVNEIENLGIASKKEVTKTDVRHVTKISFEAETSVGSVARLMYLYRSGKPISVTFECPQAELDLHIEAVSLSSGELAPEKEV